MRITYLKPEVLAEGDHTNYPVLAFDCPICQLHRIEVPVLHHPQKWEMSGTNFENVTLSPSIAHEGHYTDEDGVHHVCPSHFFIRKGNIEMA